MESQDTERSLAQTMELAQDAEAPRERDLAAALERRLRDLDRMQRESDALRAELAVRDGYVADLQRRLADTAERLATAERDLARLRAADAEHVFDRYAQVTADENAIRRRIEEAVTVAASLRDRERAAALRALRSMLNG